MEPFLMWSEFIFFLLLFPAGGSPGKWSWLCRKYDLLPLQGQCREVILHPGVFKRCEFDKQDSLK